MKVLDLHCANLHMFEGWFASEADFAGQLERGLVACPVCGDAVITKRLSAPRLNLGASPEPVPTQPQPQPALPASVTKAVTEGVSYHGETGQGRAQGRTFSGSNLASDALQAVQAVQAAWLAAAREVMANTDDVGPRFAEEARKMHYGETKERGIRGQATREEAQSLLDEGIAVTPILLPEALKGRLQ